MNYAIKLSTTYWFKSFIKSTKINTIMQTNCYKHQFPRLIKLLINNPLGFHASALSCPESFTNRHDVLINSGTPRITSN